MLGKKPEPQFEALPLGSPRPSVSYIVTKPGRLRFSLPKPYVTHEPTHGKPIRDMPVLIMNRAGEWLLELVQHEWMKAILSTCCATCGKISEPHLPQSPYCRKRNGDFITGPTWSVKKPVFLSKPGNACPSRRASSGL